MKELLRRPENLGPDLVTSWLDRLSLVSIENGTVALTSPTNFLTRHVSNNFEPALLRAWKAIDGSVTCLRITTSARRLPSGQAS